MGSAVRTDAAPGGDEAVGPKVAIRPIVIAGLAAARRGHEGLQRPLEAVTLAARVDTAASPVTPVSMTAWRAVAAAVKWQENMAQRQFE